MKKYILVFAALISSAFISFSQVSNSTVVTNLAAKDFKTLSANDKSSVIIDLRTDDEIKNKGFIKGSVQLDFLAKDAEQKIDKLDKNKTYYVYCAAGGRSGDAAEYMEKHGFKRVFNLEKGFSDWAAKGMPVEKK
jgi:rhodanese-related sulfurtransferase